MTDPHEPSAPTPSRRRTRAKAEFEARAQSTVADLEAQLRATRAQLDAIEERVTARAGRNLPAAIAVGLVLGAGVLVSTLVVEELWMLFAGVLVGFTSYELASALRFGGRDVPRVPLVVVAVLLVPTAFYLGSLGLWIGLLAAILVVSGWRLAEAGVRPSHRTGRQNVWDDLGAGLFVLCYVGFNGAITALLAAQPSGGHWLIAFLTVVVVSDTGAYASGLLFGKHPMAPKISPKKTWEGFAGAIGFSVLAGVLFATLLLDQPWWVGVVLGVVMCLTGTMGDLIESLIKRDLGIKDISTFLPGHGGFLDRLDSAIASAAAAYLLYVLFT